MGVVVVRGDDMNFKITTMSDYRYAEWLVETGAAKATPEDSHEPYEG
jgi:2-C-methyl-D-erythritol 4-phosphate cytidylyltransferase